MRSKIVERILKETPQEVRDLVREQANKADIEHYKHLIRLCREERRKEYEFIFVLKERTLFLSHLAHIPEDNNVLDRCLLECAFLNGHTLIDTEFQCMKFWHEIKHEYDIHSITDL